MKKYEIVGEKLLPVIAYGDAAGLPVETWSADKIKARHGKINELLPADTNPFYDDIPLGSWSDDTQLSRAIVHALIKAGGFDIRSIVDEHIVELRQTPEVVLDDGSKKYRGWGRSTTESINKIIQTGEIAGSGQKGLSGNGVLMKLSPLVLWQAAKDIPEYERHSQYDALTAITHDTDDARTTTKIHGDILYELVTGALAYNDIRKRALELAKEYTIPGQFDLASLLSTLQSPSITSESILHETDAKGFYAPQTLGMVYGGLALRATSLRETVYNLVNLGGDTDSTASIGAATYLFAHPTTSLPKDIDKIVARESLQYLSRSFSRTLVN